MQLDFLALLWVYLGVKTCEVFLCFVATFRVRVYNMLTFLFSLFLCVTGECPAQVFTLRMSPCSVCIFLENSYFQAWIDHFTVEN